jgi:hypothetical protein
MFESEQFQFKSPDDQQEQQSLEQDLIDSQNLLEIAVEKTNFEAKKSGNICTTFEPPT